MRAIFIGGCGRSGTTLLGSMLGVHPDHLATPETGFKRRLLAPSPDTRLDGQEALALLGNEFHFQTWELDLSARPVPQSPTVREFLEWLVHEWGRAVGKPAPAVWIDHTPVVPAWDLTRHFPEARCVHIIRDGRAVAASYRGANMDWGEKEIVPAARRWVQSVGDLLAAELAENVMPVHRVRYEDLVTDPESTLQRLCEVLELEYLPEMVEGTGFAITRNARRTHLLVGGRPDPSRLDAWRSRLSPREVERFEAVAADMLYCFGYQPEYGAAAVPSNRAERVVSTVRPFLRRRWIVARRAVRESVARVRPSLARQ